MPITNNYIIPSFSLQPNKLSFYNTIVRKNNFLENTNDNSETNPTNDTITARNCERISKPRAFHNFTLSDNARRTLKSKIAWLYYYAKPQKIITYSKKTIYNFKINFITLTLPAQQAENTSTITNYYFNQFLTELKSRTDLKNYVWRLEFQKNGNVHYHIVTDTYLDYFFLRKIWNRILSKGHYINTYSEKFSAMTLGQYNNYVNPSKKKDFNQIKEQYIRGKKEHFRQPPTVNVESVISAKNISYYIAKYFFKKSKTATNCNQLDNEKNSKNLRLWFCSRSLSRLKSVSDYCEAVDTKLYATIENFKKARVFIAKWAKMVYFNIADFSKSIQNYYKQIFDDYANEQGYFATG